MSRMIEGGFTPPPEVEQAWTRAFMAWPEWEWRRSPLGTVRHASSSVPRALAGIYPVRVSVPPPEPKGLRAATAPKGTYAERVRAALMATPRALPASNPPTPTPRFSGVRRGETAPPPIDLVGRIAAAAKKGR